VSVDERKKGASKRKANMIAGEPVSGGSGLDEGGLLATY
jgi:hypothetical protein